MNSKCLLLLISFFVMGNLIEARSSRRCNPPGISLNTDVTKKFRENLKADLLYLNCTQPSIVNFTEDDLVHPKNGSFTTPSEVFCDSLQHIKPSTLFNLPSFDHLWNTIFQNKTKCVLACSMDLNESLWPYCELIKNITTESRVSPPKEQNAVPNQQPKNDSIEEPNTTNAPDAAISLLKEVPSFTGSTDEKSVKNVEKSDNKSINHTENNNTSVDIYIEIRRNLTVDLQNLILTNPSIVNITIADLEQPKNGSFTTPSDVFCHSVQNIKLWRTFNITSFVDLCENIFKNESLCLRVCSSRLNESIIWPYCELIKNITAFITVSNVTAPSELPVVMNPSDESHFFNYLVVISILCIICYFGIYNKKKILALLIEGRNRKDRRRHASAGYRKLNTNLEEVMPFTSTAASDSMIY